MVDNNYLRRKTVKQQCCSTSFFIVSIWRRLQKTRESHQQFLNNIYFWDFPADSEYILLFGSVGAQPITC